MEWVALPPRKRRSDQVLAGTAAAHWDARVAPRPPRPRSGLAGWARGARAALWKLGQGAASSARARDHSRRATRAGGAGVPQGAPVSVRPCSRWRVSCAPSAGCSAACTANSTLTVSGPCAKPGFPPSLRGAGRFKNTAPAQLFSRCSGEPSSPTPRHLPVHCGGFKSSLFPASPSLASVYHFSSLFARDAFLIHKPSWPPSHLHTAHRKGHPAGHLGLT